MKSPSISDLEPDQAVTGVFLVQSKEVRQKKTGDPYLSLTLCDRSGDVEAKMWDNVGEVVSTFERDNFIKVKGVPQVYNNRLQFTIHKLRRVEENEIELADFFPCSKRDPAEMLAELRQVVSAMGNPHLRALIEAFLSDAEIMRLYAKAPAAKFMHHAFFGGLIEHVLSVCGLCRLIAGHYPDVDLDLLITGAFLHDIGKIYELSYERSFGYTSDGQLLGHIVIGLRMIEEKLKGLPEFPPKLRALVEHLVLSHHGELEFGSPKLPMFREALLLHYLDDLDAKMECMRSLVEQDRQVEGHWTGYNTQLARVLLKKSKYLSDAENGSGTKANSPVPATGAAAAATPLSESPQSAKSSKQSSDFAAKLNQALTGPSESQSQ